MQGKFQKRYFKYLIRLLLETEYHFRDECQIRSSDA